MSMKPTTRQILALKKVQESPTPEVLLEAYEAFFGQAPDLDRPFEDIAGELVLAVNAMTPDTPVIKTVTSGPPAEPVPRSRWRRIVATPRRWGWWTVALLALAVYHGAQSFVADDPGLSVAHWASAMAMVALIGVDQLSRRERRR